MRFATSLTAIGLITGMCHAEELRLTNSGQDTIVMKFLPSSERPKKMDEITIPPSENGSVTRVTVLGQDPYDVSFYLKPKTTPNGTTRVFHAKVGRPVPLRALARRVGSFDVNVALAAKESGEQVIYQASVAALESGNRRVEVFSGTTESDFTKEVLEHRWDTIYKAGDGNTYGAILDFGKLTFETRRFVGLFTDLAVFEDDQVCHIVGRWSALKSHGDVFFTVDRRSRTVLNGEYTFDGNRDRYYWKSKL